MYIEKMSKPLLLSCSRLISTAVMKKKCRCSGIPWSECLFITIFLCVFWRSWKRVSPEAIANRGSAKSRINSFNHLCGPSSLCSSTRRSLAHKFLGVKRGVRTVADVKFCVDFQPEQGICFLPMHFGDNYLSDLAGTPLSDIVANMTGNKTYGFSPAGTTLLNYLPRAIPFFTDINDKLPVNAAGTAVFCMNDTALGEFTRGDATMMKESGFPFLAHSFLRSEIGGDYVVIPDYHFATAHGENYRHVMNQQAETYVSLEKRKNKVFWRGTPTGPNIHCGNETSCSSCDRCLGTPRVKLVRQAVSIPRADIKFMKLRGVCADCDLSWQNQTVIGDHVQEAEWSGYRATLDMDGKADAWGSYKRYRSGSVVLRIEGEWRHWYDDRLKPWEHFIPVRRDLSDLATQIAFATSEEPEIIAKLKVITSNAEKALGDISYEGEVSRVARELAGNWKQARAS